MSNKEEFIEMIEGLIKRPAMYSSKDIGSEFFLSGFEHAVSRMNIELQLEGKMLFNEFCSSHLNLGMRNFRLNFEHNNSCHISFVKDDKDITSAKESKNLSEQYVNEMKAILDLYLQYLKEDN